MRQLHAGSLLLACSLVTPGLKTTADTVFTSRLAGGHCAALL